MTNPVRRKTTTRAASTAKSRVKPARASSGRSALARSSGTRAVEPRPKVAASRRDPRVDAYIAKAPQFARPILAHLREVVHASGPGVVETIKWGMPSFDYHGILAGMAAFKAHCSFGLWKHERIVADDPKALEAMGSFGCLKAVSDLPARATLLRYLKKARALNESGESAPRTKTARKKPIGMHPDFAAALARNAKARATLEGFAPSHQREYLEWIQDAKRDETRARRIETAIQWLAQGRKHHWKYETC